MNQLVPADVANLRCRFVSELYTFLKCQKYSISCCEDDAIDAFLNYKLAASTCDLDDDSICRLQNYKKPTLEVTCGTATPCSGQASIDLKISDTGLIYTPTIVDPNIVFDGIPISSAQATVTLTPNSIYHDATVHVSFVDQNLQLWGDEVISTGVAKVGMSTVTSPILYSLKADTQFTVDNVAALPNGYISKLRVYYTNNIGQYVPGQFWDLDLHPLLTPYRTCPSCTPIAIPDLFFADPNWADSFKILVDNAIRDLTGAVNIDFYAFSSSNVNRITLLSRVKHLPTSIWAGLRHKDLQLEYFNGTKFTTVTQSSTNPTFFGDGASNMYGNKTFTLSCANKDIEIGNQNLSMNVNAGTSEFNEIKLASTKTLNAVHINDTSTLDCSATTVTAVIVSGKVITLVE